MEDGTTLRGFKAGNVGIDVKPIQFSDTKAGLLFSIDWSIGSVSNKPLNFD